MWFYHNENLHPAAEVWFYHSNRGLAPLPPTLSFGALNLMKIVLRKRVPEKCSKKLARMVPRGRQDAKVGPRSSKNSSKIEAKRGLERFPKPI